MIKPDSLDALNDNELREVINQSETLLRKRDEERKAKALADVRALKAKAESDARALLESVGLTLKSLHGKGRKKGGQGPLYKGGRLYQHPTETALVWKANGQKPNWLRELEAKGGKALEVEVANDSARSAVNRV
jgi:DNA-binding protein H-NS